MAQRRQHRSCKSAFHTVGSSPTFGTKLFDLKGLVMKFEKIVGSRDAVLIARAADKVVFMRYVHEFCHDIKQVHGIDLDLFFQKTAVHLLFSIPHDHPTGVVEMSVICNKQSDKDYNYITFSFSSEWKHSDQESLDHNIEMVSRGI